MAASETRDRILGAAERLFAQRGFHGVSLREVAGEAGMRLSHLQYHFTSKDDLYHAVFERRILAINHARLSRLDEVERRPPDGQRDPVEEIVSAFIEPTVLVSRDQKSGGDFYAQLIAQISNEPAEHARRVSRDFTDPIARVTLKALAAALPELDRASLTWAYIFAVGAMIASISRTGRVKLLSNGVCDPEDVDRIVSLVVPFIAGGLRAVAHAETARSAAGGKLAETSCATESPKRRRAAEAASRRAAPSAGTRVPKPVRPKGTADPKRRPADAADVSESP